MVRTPPLDFHTSLTIPPEYINHGYGNDPFAVDAALQQLLNDAHPTFAYNNPFETGSLNTGDNGFFDSTNPILPTHIDASIYPDLDWDIENTNILSENIASQSSSVPALLFAPHAMETEAHEPAHLPLDNGDNSAL